MFAVIDAIQWHHPLVAHADDIIDPARRNCTTDTLGRRHCVPGCPGTFMRMMTASGYNADTGHIVDRFRQSALQLETPFQAAPVKLGVRATPPIWDHTLGWSYTFQGCPSNFLDCFFMDHSPCPKVDFNMEDRTMNLLVDKRRYAEIRGRHIPSYPDWFDAATGVGVDRPDYAVGTYITDASYQVSYAYMFRPKYNVRREVQRRVDKFNLTQDSCSIMHVRRGDSGVTHTMIYSSRYDLSYSIVSDASSSRKSVPLH